MPTTIERPVAANVVSHATEYPPDRERRNQQWEEHSSNESRQQRHDTEPGPQQDEEPAVLVDAEHHEDHLLDGVAAYRAVAQHVLEPGLAASAKQVYQDTPEQQPADAVRHAYEEHSGEIETHQLNVNT